MFAGLLPHDGAAGGGGAAGHGCYRGEQGRHGGEGRKRACRLLVGMHPISSFVLGYMRMSSAALSFIMVYFHLHSYVLQVTF